MNPENGDLSYFEEEIAKEAENKEKKDYINLSFASGADLVKQIKEKGYFDRNEYQETCRYAVIQTNDTDKNKVWDFEHEDELDNENKHQTFNYQLPTLLERTNKENIRVFFCGSKYDIRLEKIGDKLAKLEGGTGENWRRFLTPDGIQYQYIQAAKGGLETILYSDQQVSLDEVKRISDLVKENDGFYIDGKNLAPHVDFDYD